MKKIAVMCYCRKGEFCHRDLVGALIIARAEKIGIEVEVAGIGLWEASKYSQKGYICLDVTVKAGTPVSPTWDIVMPVVNARKQGKETAEMQEVYKNEYAKLLNSRKQAVYAWIDKIIT